jgi:hypothetical protein
LTSDFRSRSTSFVRRQPFSHLRRSVRSFSIRLAVSKIKAMLSSLPKLADRAFILGDFLPALLFAVALLFLFHDQRLPNALIEAVTRKEYGVAIYLLLAVWAVAVVLLVLNNPLYRFLEGYAPPFPGRLAEWLKTRNRRRLQSGLDEIRALHDEWKEQGSAFPDPKRDRYQRLRRELVKWMPPERYILPTRFGNAIRAFEVYPSEIYGADGVVIWPRLSSVMPKAFGDQIEDIRSQIDFLVNCCFFSAIIAFLGFSRTIYSASYQDLHTAAGWFLWAVGGAIATCCSYRLAVTRVPA